MDGFTVRQKFLLNNLIEKGPLSIKTLSRQIDVSERTIMRELSSINEWLKNYRLHIFKNGDNLFVRGSQRDIETIRKLFEGVPPLWLLTQEQRQVLITAQLLLAKEPIKSAYFGCQFNVVEGTIIFYLDKIESWLRTKNLKLIRRRGYGLEVIGSDWSKRNAFAELLYNYKSISELLAFLYEDNNDYSLHAFFEVTFGKELVSSVKHMMQKLYSDSTVLKESDVDNFSTFIHLMLAIERTRSNMPIELPEDIIQDTLFMKEFTIIKDLMSVLHENEIELPESELAYLAIHLMEDRNIYSGDETMPKELGFDVNDAVLEIVSITAKRLNTPLEGDSQLISGLEQHIKPALYRLTMGLEVRNPIINDIKEYYKELYEAVDYACKVVFSKYNLILPANEVGYVTMHIGAALERQQSIESKLRVLVICPNGISTVKILCGRMKSKFPEIGEIDACSLREMDEKLKGNYDMILSTVDVNRKGDHEILFISPFLPSKDLEKISQMIKCKLEEGGGLRKVQNPLFFHERDESVDFDAADKMFQNFKLKMVDTDHIQDTIKKIVIELTDSSVISEPDKVEHQILKREARGSVVIPGSHVALIHIRTEEIEEPFVGVFRQEHFIEMKSAGFSVEKVDTILVMLARKHEKDFILEMLGKISASLVESEHVINVLRFGDITDIRNELIEIINREECI